MRVPVAPPGWKTTTRVAGTTLAGPEAAPTVAGIPRARVNDRMPRIVRMKSSQIRIKVTIAPKKHPLSYYPRMREGRFALCESVDGRGHWEDPGADNDSLVFGPFDHNIIDLTRGVGY